MTRSQNSILNVLTNYGIQLLTIVLSFVTRTIFIRMLGTSYLGVEGLFTNVLSMLSLAELGFGSAIVFKLYRAIADDDKERILALLDFYRKVYVAVGLCVVAAGLCLIPALPLLVKDYERFAELGLNAPLIFLMYLFNSAASYWFFAYKTAFVTAEQKTYQLTRIGYLILIVNTGLQILALVLFHSFYLYLGVQVAFVVVRNCVYARICDRKYPFVRQKPLKPLAREERRAILRDCSALLLFKLNMVVVQATDNIVLSAFLGLSVVGLYANYSAVKNWLCSLLALLITSLSGSLGNLNAEGRLDWTRLVFRTIDLIAVWIYGVFAIGTWLLLDEFITCWIGAGFVVNSFTREGVTVFTPVALLCGLEIYARGQQVYLDLYRETMGLFQQLRLRPVLSVLVNLGVSLATVQYLGIAGCVLGTVVSYMLVNMVIDPRAIHKYGLQEPIGPYRLRQLLHLAVTAGAGAVCWGLCRLIPLGGWLGFIVRGMVVVLAGSGAYALCFYRTREFRFLIRTIRGFLKKPAAGGDAT